MRVLLFFCCILGAYYSSATGMRNTICPRPDPLPLTFLGTPVASGETLDLVSLEAPNELLKKISAFYLVRHEPTLGAHLTFCGSSPKQVIHHYFDYLITAPDTSEYKLLMALYAKRACPAVVLRFEELYALACNERACCHKEIRPSEREAWLRIFVHKIVEHSAADEWYDSVNRLIGISFQEALSKLQRAKR